jgi:uncharacterized glyoxalase superfamily protein PhnB
MRVESLKPFIPSGGDFETAKRFFLDLGFVIRWEGGGLAELALDGAAFLLQDYSNREMQENLMVAVDVDDLDAWWAHLQASGALERYEGVRAKPPTDFPWGRREVHLIDPAGVCWHFS